MELLTAGGAPIALAGRSMGRALGVSAVVHVTLAAVLLSLPVRAPSPVDEPIEVTMEVGESPVPEPVAAPEPVDPAPVEIQPPAVPRAVRQAAQSTSRPAVSPEAPVPQPEAASLDAPPAPPERVPDPVPEPGPAAAAAPDGLAVGQPAAAHGSVPGAGSGAVVGRPGGTASGEGRGDPLRHRAIMDRYRAQLLRSRIASVFRYPAEARDLELTGQVLLALSIHGDGRLLEVRLAGRCPHAILCDDGLRTVRAAAPFPPLPPELGPSIVVEVPLTYTFE